MFVRGGLNEEEMEMEMEMGVYQINPSIFCYFFFQYFELSSS